MRDFKLKAVVVAVFAITSASASLAQSVDSSDEVIAPSGNGDIFIQANNDENNGTGGFVGEGVFIRSNSGNLTSGAATAQFRTGGGAQIYGSTEARLESTGSRFTAAGNAASINSDGTTSVNTGNGSGNVVIGNAANTTTIQSGTNAITGVTNNITASGTNSANNVTGTTNVNTTGTATTSIGNANAAVNVSGTTKINDSVNAATSINTGSSTGAVNIGNSSNAANVTNINSTTNNIGAGYASTNNIGTGGTATTNNIGNSQTTTQVNAQAGNAKMTLANNSAVLTVPSATTVGGNVVNNGVAVSNTQSTLTGGNTSTTRLTLNDTAATFSRVSNGAPITVTGVADGRNDFDAINVRQFANAIAGVSAMANIPTLQQGKESSIGVGVGNFMGKTALALGLNYRVDAKTAVRVTASSGLSSGAKFVVGAGAAWAF
jgi:hypothetical protein